MDTAQSLHGMQATGSALRDAQGLVLLACRANRLFRQYALGYHEMAVPVRLLEGVDGHRLATARRMNETVIAQVDSDVVDLAALGVEEQQVAWLQILAVNLLPVA